MKPTSTRDPAPDADPHEVRRRRPGVLTLRTAQSSVSAHAGPGATPRPEAAQATNAAVDRATVPFRAIVACEAGESKVFTLDAPADKADIEARMGMPLYLVSAGHHARTDSYWSSFRDTGTSRADAAEQIREWNMAHPGEVFPSEEPRYL